MELTHLYYFGVVLDAKNIVEASRLLNVSQSTLTGAIQKMEQELGVALFDRSGRKLVPTGAAAVLREFSSEVFRNLEYMRADIAASKEPPHMRVALASPSIMTKIPQFQQNCPDIPIAAQMRKEKDFLYYLNQDLFDLCITTEQLDYPDIASERLFTDYLWVSVTKDSPLAQYPMAHIRDLKDQTIILPNGAKQNALFSRFMELVKVLQKYKFSIKRIQFAHNSIDNDACCVLFECVKNGNTLKTMSCNRVEIYKNIDILTVI